MKVVQIAALGTETGGWFQGCKDEVELCGTLAAPLGSALFLAGIRPCSTANTGQPKPTQRLRAVFFKLGGSVAKAVRTYRYWRMTPAMGRAIDTGLSRYHVTPFPRCSQHTKCSATHTVGHISCPILRSTCRNTASVPYSTLLEKVQNRGKAGTVLLYVLVLHARGPRVIHHHPRTRDSDLSSRS